MALRMGIFSRISYRNPHGTFAAFAADPRIALGLKLGDGVGVGHASIEASSDTLGNRQYRLLALDR